MGELLNVQTGIIMLKFLKDESGATAIEYGLLAALIGVAIIGGASALGVSISGLFTGTNSEVEAVFTS